MINDEYYIKYLFKTNDTWSYIEELTKYKFKMYKYPLNINLAKTQ